MVWPLAGFQEANWVSSAKMHFCETATIDQCDDACGYDFFYEDMEGVWGEKGLVHLIEAKSAGNRGKFYMSKTEVCSIILSRWLSVYAMAYR